MKKLLATLLCLLMLGSVALVSCNDDSPNTSETASTGEQSTTSSTSGTDESQGGTTSVDDNGWVDGIVGYLGNGVWGREMPEFTWDRDTFTVLVYNNTTQQTYFSEEIEPYLYETTDSVINEAVERRNREIEAKYGVTIKARAVDNVYTTLTQELQAPDPQNADVAMPFASFCTTLAQSGQLYDLREFEEDGYIDLEMPWWDQNANESFSIADKLYFTTGDMSIMQKIVSICIMFNKDLLKTQYPDADLYEMVRNHTWTLDTMMEMATAFTYESDNVHGLTADDNWGYIIARNDALMMYLAAGQRLITKDANDEPILALGSDERSLNIAQELLTKLQQKDTWTIVTEDMQTSENMWNKVVQMMGEGKALFRSTAFSAVKKLRAYDANFGLIPFPLVDENQEDYYTPCNAAYAYGIVIPYSAPDPEFSAFMLDVISAASKGDNASGLTRAYSEVVLKGKDLDEESGEMLDNYIFNNIVYDLGIIYNFGVDAIFRTLMQNNSTAIVSTLEAQRDSIQTKLYDVIDLYKERS